MGCVWATCWNSAWGSNVSQREQSTLTQEQTVTGKFDLQWAWKSCLNLSSLLHCFLSHPLQAVLRLIANQWVSEVAEEEEGHVIFFIMRSAMKIWNHLLVVTKFFNFSQASPKGFKLFHHLKLQASAEVSVELFSGLKLRPGCVDT